MQTKPWYCPNCGREYRVPIEASGLGPCQRCKAGEPPPLDRTGENRRLKIAIAAAVLSVSAAIFMLATRGGAPGVPLFDLPERSPGVGILSLSSQCLICGGAGNIDCPHCVNGMADCPICVHGTMTNSINGHTQKCTVCNGRGENLCTFCQAGRAACTFCNGTGRR